MTTEREARIREQVDLDKVRRLREESSDPALARVFQEYDRALSGLLNELGHYEAAGSWRVEGAVRNMLDVAHDARVKAVEFLDIREAR